ncbi:CheR family methyltransferase [Melioribacteraceae bacterium 4301-Me]|uniref:CheR family methyltransferase n=1 Tax=Pyranulibacter aquaticus TaxID=3163344 RepID=UPI00359BBB7D
MIESSLSAELLDLASNIIADKLGLSFPQDRWKELERGIMQAAQASNKKNVEEYLQSLLLFSLSENECEILTSYLTNSETYFFRDEKLFDALKFHILPSLIESREKEKRLRIWSAGCSTGEEPYSIALLLNQLIQNIDEWNITILASDINPISIEKMKKGLYNEWSFRGVPAFLKESCFTKVQNGQYEILNKFKKMITPAIINLAKDNFPSLNNNTTAMDIILCRNVLMYFNYDTVNKTINNFYNCLVDNGWLIVSPSDFSQILFSKFSSEYYLENILYRKNENRRTIDSYSETQKNLTYNNLLNDITKQELTTNNNSNKIKKSSTEKTLDSTTVTYQRACELYSKNKFTEAADLLSQYLNEKPNNSAAFILLARIYANLQKLVEASFYCKKAISIDSLNPINYYLFAVILQEQNCLEEALSAIKKAIYLDKNFVIAYLTAGNILSKLGKIKEAKRNIRSALSILKKFHDDSIVPESDGLTVKQIKELIKISYNIEI